MAHPIRNCLACGQVDDHPRDHVVLPDGSSAYWHMDCHARATGCQPCQDVLDHAGVKQGDELRSHIVANDPAGAAKAARASSEA
jgi:flavoprotein